LSLAPGDPNCPEGGSEFTDGDGNITYACNGAEGPAGPAGPSSIVFGDCIGGSCTPCDFTNLDPTSTTMPCRPTQTSNGTEYARVTVASSSKEQVVECRASGVTKLVWTNNTNFAQGGCAGGRFSIDGDIVESTGDTFDRSFSYYFSEPVLDDTGSGEIQDKDEDHFANWTVTRTFILPANTSGTYRFRMEQSGSLPFAFNAFGCGAQPGDYTVDHDVSFYCVTSEPL